jgi:muramoyltetrapeptide carboxypeptidase LdcA involved in peptidoglycan recycling
MAELEDGLAVLEGFGWQPVPSGRLDARQDYLAGDDETRAAAVMAALSDASLRAVFCARGGYGSTRLLERLDPAALSRDPKPLVGFSDVTALLSWAERRAGVIAVHGPVLTQLGRLDAPSHQALHALLTGALEPGRPLLEGLTPLRGGRCEGVLRGGNLTLLGALAGTPDAVPLDGTVLFVEDTNEPVYRLDRLFTQLRAQPGWGALAGLVVGDMGVAEDNGALARLLADVAAHAPCPVVCGAAVGHGTRNLALPVGARVTLDAAAGVLTLAGPALTRSAAAPPLRAPRPAGPPPRSAGTCDRCPPGLDALLDEGLRDGVFAAAALGVRHRGTTVVRRQAGWLTLLPAPEPLAEGARFDLASLTKPFAAVTIAMRAVAEGWLDLEAPVPALVPWLRGRGSWDAVRLRHLLQHSAGLPDWRPLFAFARRAAPDAWPGDPAIEAAVRERLASLPFLAPPGERVLYSDLGFLALGAALASAGKASLGTLFRREVASPLKLGDTGFRPVEEWLPVEGGRATRLIAATEVCPWRGGRLLRGAVSDENAYALGGVAPHAGLFASLDDVVRWAAALLDAALGRPTPLGLSPSVLETFWDAPRVGGSTWALGWDRPSPVGSAGGRHLSDDAVGHLGFTGGSVWIDRRRDLVVVLLTSRTHPSRHDVRIRALRPRLHDLIVSELDA